MENYQIQNLDPDSSLNEVEENDIYIDVETFEKIVWVINIAAVLGLFIRPLVGQDFYLGMILYVYIPIVIIVGIAYLLLFWEKDRIIGILFLSMSSLICLMVMVVDMPTKIIFSFAVFVLLIVGTSWFDAYLNKLSEGARVWVQFVKGFLWPVLLIIAFCFACLGMFALLFGFTEEWWLPFLAIPAFIPMVYVIYFFKSVVRLPKEQAKPGFRGTLTVALLGVIYSLLHILFDFSLLDFFF